MEHFNLLRLKFSENPATLHKANLIFSVNRKALQNRAKVWRLKLLPNARHFFLLLSSTATFPIFNAILHEVETIRTFPTLIRSNQAVIRSILL